MKFLVVLLASAAVALALTDHSTLGFIFSFLALGVSVTYMIRERRR